MHRMRRVPDYRIALLFVVFSLFICVTLNATRKNAVNLINDAKIQIEKGELKKAFLLLQKACEEDELFDEPHYHIARIHFLKNDVDLAVVNIKKALSLAPHEVKYKKLMNECRFKQAVKTPAEAETILNSIIEDDRGFTKAYLKLLQIYFSEKKLDPAKEIILKISENVSNGKIKFAKTEEYLFVASKAYLEFLKGKHLFSYRMISGIPEAIRKQPGEISRICSMISGEENKSLQLLLKGDALVRKKDYLAAEHYYKEALESADDKGYVERKLQAIGNIKSASKTFDVITELVKAEKLDEATAKLQEYRDDILPLLDDKEFYLKKIQQAEDSLMELRKKIENEKNKATQLRSLESKLKGDFQRITELLKEKKLSLAEEKMNEFNAELEKHGLKNKFQSKLYTDSVNEIQKFKQLLVLYNEGKEKFNDNKFQESISVFEEINQKAEGFENVKRYLGGAYCNLKEYEKALPYLMDYSLEMPKDLEVRYLIALSLQETGRLKEALDIFNEVNAEKSDYRDVLNRSREIKGILDAAERKKMIFLGSTVAAVVAVVVVIIYFVMVYPQKRREKYKELARDYTLSRNWKKAMKYVDMVLAMNLEKREAAQYQLYMSQILLATGNPSRAKVFCENAQKNNFSLRGIEKILVECMLALREMTPAAMEKYELYYRKYPDDNRLVELMGRYYIQTEMFDDESLEIVKKYYQMNPTDNRVLMHIVKALMDEQSVSLENIEYFEKGLTVIGDDKRGKLLMMYAKACFQLEQYRKILSMKEELIEFGGDTREINDIIVNSAVAVNEIEELKNYYEALENSGKTNVNMKKSLKFLREQLLDI